MLSVIDLPLPLHNSVKGSGSQVYFVSINSTDGEPDLVINFIAPVVPSPIEPPASTASAHLLPPIQQIDYTNLKIKND